MQLSFETSSNRMQKIPCEIPEKQYALFGWGDCNRIRKCYIEHEKNL